MVLPVDSGGAVYQVENGGIEKRGDFVASSGIALAHKSSGGVPHRWAMPGLWLGGQWSKIRDFAPNRKFRHGKRSMRTLPDKAPLAPLSPLPFICQREVRRSGGAF
jgi:hypothetical protein